MVQNHQHQNHLEVSNNTEFLGEGPGCEISVKLLKRFLSTQKFEKRVSPNNHKKSLSSHGKEEREVQGIKKG